MKSKNWIILMILFLIIFNAFVWNRAVFDKPSENTEIYFLNVGQGDSELVILPGGVKILIDGGPDSRILGQLDSILDPFDRYFDLIILSHQQADHFNGLIEVMKRYQVGLFIFNGLTATANSWSELVKTIKENKIPTVVLGAGDRIYWLEDEFDFLSPDRNFIQNQEANETALVALLKTQASKILFTADIGEELENYLAGRYNLDVDVLKVAHHGSKYSSSAGFLSEASPKVAVIEVGRNSYGHPTAEALSRLASVGAQIFRTDQNGTVKLVINGRNISIFEKE